jgi:hypothetical protein
VSTCNACKGHKLQPHLKAGSDKLLFTEDECQTCGGKGYIQGGRTYSVAVFRNGTRTATVHVLARTAPEALFLAAELVDQSIKVSGKGDLMAKDDSLGMEVIEV